MSIACSFGQHKAGPDPVWNAGFYFTRCSRCSRDLIRGQGAWQQVPAGYRVVWLAAEGVRPSHGYNRSAANLSLSDRMASCLMNPEGKALPARVEQPFAGDERRDPASRPWSIRPESRRDAEPTQKSHEVRHLHWQQYA